LQLGVLAILGKVPDFSTKNSGVSSEGGLSTDFPCVFTILHLLHSQNFMNLWNARPPSVFEVQIKLLMIICIIVLSLGANNSLLLAAFSEVDFFI
jgi:hypothetical protein